MRQTCILNKNSLLYAIDNIDRDQLKKLNSISAETRISFYEIAKFLLKVFMIKKKKKIKQRYYLKIFADSVLCLKSIP